METSQNSPPSRRAPQPQNKRGGKCCLWSCLSIIGIFAISGVCLLTAPFILQAVGLIGSPADVRYGAAPDVYASAQLEETLDEFAIEGAKVYVIPEQGTNRQTAFIILDSSAGFDGFTDMAVDSSENDVNDRVDEILAVLVDKNQQYNLRISRVAINYRDENGETFINLTTSMEEVEDYIAGKISYEEFYGELGMDFGKILTQLWEGYNE